jgi:hypothetical protein
MVYEEAPRRNRNESTNDADHTGTKETMNEGAVMDVSGLQVPGTVYRERFSPLSKPPAIEKGNCFWPRGGVRGRAQHACQASRLYDYFIMTWTLPFCR